jgi:hypothetical protein
MAVYRVAPLACLRILIVDVIEIRGDVVAERDHVSFTSPRQTINSPKSAGITQQRHEWKTLQK